VAGAAFGAVENEMLDTRKYKEIEMGKFLGRKVSKQPRGHKTAAA
jgi:hypothetical protein